MDTDRVPVALADRLGPGATLELVGLLDASERECVEMTISQATDRFERRLIEETSKLRVEIGAFRLDMREGFGSIRQEMAAQKFDMIKWSFAFWIAQVAAIAGVVATLFRMTGR